MAADVFARIFRAGAPQQYGLYYTSLESEGQMAPQWIGLGGGDYAPAAPDPVPILARLDPYLRMTGDQLISGWSTMPSDVRAKLGETPEDFAKKVAYAPDGQGGWVNRFVERETTVLEAFSPLITMVGLAFGASAITSAYPGLVAGAEVAAGAEVGVASVETVVSGAGSPFAYTPEFSYGLGTAAPGEFTLSQLPGGALSPYVAAGGGGVASPFTLIDLGGAAAVPGAGYAAGVPVSLLDSLRKMVSPSGASAPAGAVPGLLPAGAVSSSLLDKVVKTAGGLLAGTLIAPAMGAENPQAIALGSPVGAAGGLSLGAVVLLAGLGLIAYKLAVKK